MGSPLPPDPYAALGISKDATPAAVKTAHRKLVLKCHPDKVTDPAAKQEASDRFHKIQSAYEILIDEDRRYRYDAQARLAELKREAMERRGGSGEGMRGNYESRNTFTSSRQSRESTSKDDYYATRASESMAPQFEERRPDFATAPSPQTSKPAPKPAAAPRPAAAPAPAPATAAATAADFDNTPPRATARKEPEPERSSRRSANDIKDRSKPAARDPSRERQRQREEKKQRAQRETQRDRDRKHEERRHGAYAEDESESNSDEYSRRARRSREERPREERPRDERPRDDEAELERARQDYFEKAQRQEKEAATDANLDPLTRKMYSQHHKAWDYIRQSRHRSHATDSERRPSPTRGNSSKEKIEYTLRSDARGQQVPVMVRRSSARPKTEEREPEPSRRRTTRDHEHRSPERESVRRAPPLPKSASSSGDGRLPFEKSRAQSWDDMGTSGLPPLKIPVPGIQRAETFNNYGAARRTETFAPSSKYPPRTTDLNDMLPPTPGMTPTIEVSPTSRSYYNYGKHYADDHEIPTTDGYRTTSDSVRVETREPDSRGRQRMPQFSRQMTRSPDKMPDYRESARETRPRMADSRYSSSSSAVPSNSRKTSYVYTGNGNPVEQLNPSRQNSGRSVPSPRDVKPPGPLYGEIPTSRGKYSGMDAYPSVNYSQTVRPENVKTRTYELPNGDRPAAMNRGGSYSTVPVR